VSCAATSETLLDAELFGSEQVEPAALLVDESRSVRTRST
jgi:transcriptional regulator with AAA-type ATPase domain